MVNLFIESGIVSKMKGIKILKGFVEVIDVNWRDTNTKLAKIGRLVT